jgi:hypothetical protein
VQALVYPLIRLILASAIKRGNLWLLYLPFLPDLNISIGGRRIQQAIDGLIGLIE